MKTTFLYHSDFKRHDAGPRHPERAARLEAMEASLRSENLWDGLRHRKFKAADDEHLLLCHKPELVKQVRRLAQSGGGNIDGDTHVSPPSFEVAKMAVGAALDAVDAVLGDECDNAFAAVRPPGHHAESGRAMGFCLFNNVGIAARYAQRKHHLERIAILDWDVHHGNGTQEIFYEDPSVLFCSVHQSPLYPGTGRSWETGSGAGVGTTLNLPLPAGCGHEEYADAWQVFGRAVEKVAPQLILISAGFDAHARDPLGGMNLFPSDFAHLTRVTKEWAARLCDRRLICVLEGGYDLDGLSESIAAVIKELMNDK